MSKCAHATITYHAEQKDTSAELRNALFVVPHHVLGNHEMGVSDRCKDAGNNKA